MASLSSFRRMLLFILVPDSFFRFLYVSPPSNQVRVIDIFAAKVSVGSDISTSSKLNEKLTTTFRELSGIGVSSFLYPCLSISFPQFCSSLPSIQSSLASQRFPLRCKRRCHKQTARTRRRVMLSWSCKKFFPHLYTPKSHCEQPINENQGAMKFRKPLTWLRN